MLCVFFLTVIQTVFLFVPQKYSLFLNGNYFTLIWIERPPEPLHTGTSEQHEGSWWHLYIPAMAKGDGETLGFPLGKPPFAVPSRPDRSAFTYYLSETPLAEKAPWCPAVSVVSGCPHAQQPLAMEPLDAQTKAPHQSKGFMHGLRSRASNLRKFLTLFSNYNNHRWTGKAVEEAGPEQMTQQTLEQTLNTDLFPWLSMCNLICALTFNLTFAVFDCAYICCFASYFVNSSIYDVIEIWFMCVRSSVVKVYSE